MTKRSDPRLVRLDDSWTALPNPYDIPVELCAGPGVPIEPAALDELLTVLDTQRTLESLAGDGVSPRIERVVCTPDFHKGAGIPIGTVLSTSGALVPQAVGNDINCGMRVEATSLDVEQVRPRLDELERRLRHLFFEGGRHIGLTPAQREGLLREGLPGLLAEGPLEHHVRDADRLHAGAFPAASAEEFRDWVNSGGGTSYDSIIGGVGGGNHFAELQYVAAIHDGPTAYAWGLTPGRVVTMVHSGSLSLGHQAGATGRHLARREWPPTLPLPANGILPLPITERTSKSRQRYLTAFANAANFAIGNRYFLSLMMRTGLTAAVGELDARLVYDAPHNLLWPGDDGAVLHRKGATPAGLSADGWGEPVIVPGSMGAPSYLLRGLGNPRALNSACHGAGRSVPRGAAARAGDAELDEFLREFRVVTPLNHRDPTVAARRDVISAWRRDLKQEAPWAYKEVRPVVDSLRKAAVAEPVAELRPLLTVKG
ncbi:RtcB family protein [Dactylosporangium sp. CA-233914]|uniref:RtcB family protein n=1 Tax=Dactylosporangium sp. CA-233914 TaxID=3239934 RepID=UPI003D900DF7